MVTTTQPLGQEGVNGDVLDHSAIEAGRGSLVTTTQSLRQGGVSGDDHSAIEAGRVQW